MTMTYGETGDDVPAAILAKTSDARYLITRGTAKYSSRNEFMVQVTRDAAQAGLSATRLSLLLGNGLTRNSVLGLAHRVKPAILFKSTSRKRPMKASTLARRATRKETRSESRNLSTRLSRLQPQELKPVIFGGVIASPAAKTNVIARTKFAPRCCWAGCANPPRAYGKPYCEAHDSGIKLADPIDFKGRYRV